MSETKYKPVLEWGPLIEWDDVETRAHEARIDIKIPKGYLLGSVLTTERSVDIVLSVWVAPDPQDGEGFLCGSRRNMVTRDQCPELFDYLKSKR